MFISDVWDIIFRASSLGKKLKSVSLQGLKWEITRCLESFFYLFTFFNVCTVTKGTNYGFM